jgi:hypothetical protein
MAMATSFRYAEVARSDRGRPDKDEVANYLPANYFVIAEDPGRVIIAGRDDSGWTLDDYVIPRLGSGLIWVKEIGAPPPELAVVIPPVPDRDALIRAIETDDSGFLANVHDASALADSIRYQWGRP